MYLSVIISTYNQPLWLEKVLYAYNQQTYKNFEIIIADDGSDEETLHLVKKMKNRLEYPITHVWHSDEGFRKCTILNKAILTSSGKYLVFTDGDCIPRADFLETHIKHHKPGFFLSGGLYRLNKKVSQDVTLEDIRTQRCFNLKHLRNLGQHPRLLKDLKLTLKNKRLVNFMNKITPTNASWNGHNSSGFKSDLLVVKGFDERMKYGGEDRELGERLFNIGIQSKQIRYEAICLHLDHSRGYVTEEDWEKNYQIRKETKRKHLKNTSFGLK